MSKYTEIDAVILCGGFGTRLASKVSGKPKVLAKVKNHPFLEYLLNQLNNANITKVILCTGFLGSQIKNAFGDNYKNIHILYSEEKIPLGTGGSLRNSLPLIKSEDVLVMNGDSFCDLDLKKFCLFHKNKKSNVSMSLTSVSDSSSFGKVILGNNNDIIEFQEKIKGSSKGIINAGIYLIKKSLISKIPKNKKMSLEKDIFPKWIGKGFYGYKGGNFIDIGTPENYAKAEQFFTGHRL